MKALDTKSALLAEAENLVRTKGYASFSYADLAERVGIRKASIHHHFPTKEELGAVLIDTYLERFTAQLKELGAEDIDTRSKLLTYGDFFAASLEDGQMPLCGALAADAAYLPASLQERVRIFFELHLEWLEAVLREGAAKHDFKLSRPYRKTALMLLSALQGASIVAWALKDPSVIKPVFRQLVEGLAAK
ncbi:TetR/AcrR family transcriptional regulator [Hyphomicrobium sp. NDB2Meth4]|uniref:TetR/AcrR family transcriptional regulator n=1 Tax=Hyphomicrobium sp. NDB2Meth4 TaxID=1892846 RepID=UPI0009317465|nr:TetR/AcrR family transcriptional regulator [Hyphomicrobium sp. NDB2Meth4]